MSHLHHLGKAILDNYTLWGKNSRPSSHEKTAEDLISQTNPAVMPFQMKLIGKNSGAA
jgi:hypothetical protein